MPKQRVSVIITDLDDTLYSWVDVWHESFRAMLEQLVQDSGIPRATLIDEIRAVHQQHGTSEYAFLVDELPSLQAKHPGQHLAEVYHAAIEAHRLARERTLELFPGAMETLQTLKSRGCLIVAYTETMGLYTNYRLKRLGLDGLIDVVYLPEDHEYPANLTPEQLRNYTARYESLESTQHRHTPKGERKPNPQVLRDIMADVGAVPDYAVYVGDKPFKDVAMARQAGITSVLASYGDALDHPGYKLLRAVTHWNAEDVEREMRERREMQESGLGRADFDLEDGYAELLGLFDFAPHRP